MSIVSGWLLPRVRLKRLLLGHTLIMILMHLPWGLQKEQQQEHSKEQTAGRIETVYLAFVQHLP